MLPNRSKAGRAEQAEQAEQSTRLLAARPTPPPAPEQAEQASLPACLITLLYEDARRINYAQSTRLPCSGWASRQSRQAEQPAALPPANHLPMPFDQERHAPGRNEMERCPHRHTHTHAHLRTRTPAHTHRPACAHGHTHTEGDSHSEHRTI